MHVSALSRYPFKSFQGEVLDQVELDSTGVPGDRRWALVDSSTGKTLSAKREPRLLDAAARTAADGAVVVTLPDGSEHETTDPALAVAAQRWLDREVAVASAAEASGVYEFNVSSEDDGSPLMDIPCPPGTFLDLAAVHILTTASLRAIAASHPEGRWEPARFRPTILVEADEEGFVEDDWIGKEVVVGGAVVQPFMPTVRCAAMTTRPQLGLPRDLDIAKVVNREHGGSLGVYCTVLRPGTVSTGDTLTLR